MYAWKTFSEPIDWISAACSKQNNKKQVFRFSLQIFCYNTDGIPLFCHSHIIRLHFHISYTNITTHFLEVLGLLIENNNLPSKVSASAGCLQYYF